MLPAVGVTATPLARETQKSGHERSLMRIGTPGPADKPAQAMRCPAGKEPGRNRGHTWFPGETLHVLFSLVFTCGDHASPCSKPSNNAEPTRSNVAPSSMATA